jgi:DNA-directed RNA polymerase subunit RPC12/RpoP
MAGRRKEPGGAASLAALVALLALAGRLPEVARAEDAEQPAGPVGYLRCPECGLEFPAPDRGRPVLCPRCGQKKVVMEFSTTARGANEGPTRSWVFPVVVGGLVAVLAAALVILGRLRASRESRRQAEARQDAAPDAAERQEVARWHEHLKRQVTRSRARRME